MKRKYIIPIFSLLLFISTNSFGQLHGTYTIGKSGTENYPSITAAVNAIYNLGITNTVFFKISPGIYEEQVYIPFIIGAEVYSPVFFEAANGDSSSVLITFKPSIDSVSYTIAMEHTRHIIFRNLSLGTDTTSGRIVELGRGCLNIQFLNCQFIGQKEGDALISAPCMAGDYNQYIMIRNNLFLNGSQAVHLCQDGSAPDINTFIENNVFENQSISGVSLKNHKEALVMGNTIINNINASGFCGLKFDNCSGATQVVSNKIYMTNIGVNSFGIRLFKSSGILGGEALVANNFIYQNTQDWSVGINITTSDFTNIYHNSVRLTGYSTGSSCMSYIFGKNSTLKNNNFVNEADGYTMLLTGVQSLVNDHNNHYFSGSNLADMDGSLIADLAAWKIASQQGSGSMSVNPEFCNDTNLHTFSDSLNNKGIQIISMNTDIDGELRNNPPDIGADEFSPFVYSLGPDLSACANDSLVIDAGMFDDYQWQDLSHNRFYTLKTNENKYKKDKMIVRINNHGCWFSDSIQTEFFAYPEFDLGKDSTFCINYFSEYKIHGPVNYTSYTWNDMSHDSVFILKKPDNIGTVKVFLTVVDSMGCAGSDTVEFTFIICGGTKDANQSIKLQIWPNPTQNMLNIEFDNQIGTENLSIRINNAMGKAVLQNQLYSPNSIIDLSNLSRGIYILKLYQKDSLLGIYKIIKQ